MRIMKIPHLLILLTLIPSFAMGQRAMTATDKALLRQPSSPRISPDGRSVAFIVREADTAANRWRTQVHVVDARSRVATQVTQAGASSSDPAWSPDGRWLSFLSTRPAVGPDGTLHEGTAALFALPADGGEAVLLCALERDIEEYCWAPDGNAVALLTEGEYPTSFAAERQRRAAAKLEISVSGDPSAGKTLWLLDLAQRGGAQRGVRRIAELDAGAEGFSWFPDGERLLYQTNYTGEYNDEQKWDLWAVGRDGAKEQLTDMAGPEHSARVSPDGTRIACITQTVPDIEFAKTEISLLNLETRRLVRLTADVPSSVEEFRWSPDGGSIIAVFNEGTSALLYRVDASSGERTRLTDPALVLREFDVSAGAAVAFTAADARSLDEIRLLTGREMNVLTGFSTQLAPFLLGEQRVISVRSRDGLHDIEAVLVLPAGYREGTRIPLLLAYHGGPYSDFDHRFWQYYPVEVLAAKGWGTVMPNIRGSSGYSDAFGQANRHDLGGGDFRDAMDVVDYLVAKGIADSARLAVMGGSYGGYMTNWTISQTQRFRSAVSMYGIFSWFTDWSNSWQPDFERMFLGQYYWELPLDMANPWIARSPQTYVRDIVTPTLILQGDRDVYTNISNSREMYQALKTLGRDVSFVVYHGAGHGLRTFPNQWIDAMERCVHWIMTK